ncbi:fungal-specific transcription factor domain-containing protein [Lipomyces oligophaga]|uniref:fungal-specific transcription factor domain-containing protein n=1 Tax=Lipomyces oligophaga TaxID=45792 RepID=UPI0034CE44A0
MISGDKDSSLRPDTIGPSKSSTDDSYASISDISCRVCRRRKVKCGRELPVCRVCSQTSQQCEYPSGHLKPGPKIGSSQRRHKRSKTETSSTGYDSPGGATENHSVSSVISTSPVPSVSSASALHESPKSFNYLSFIMHPSHELSTAPEIKTQSPPVSKTTEVMETIVIPRACEALTISPSELKHLMSSYFRNMLAVQLFHEPTFEVKLQQVHNPNEVHALLAGMLAYAIRFEPETGEPNHGSRIRYLHGKYLELALKFVEQALVDCGDDSPSLCLLQAYILSTYGILTHGVRGRAWRALGSCIRIAYELNLHLVDSTEIDYSLYPDLWVENEEKRRAWWTIWEMDVYASAIRRCPTAIDWKQIETLLVVDNEYWYSRTPCPSAFLESDYLVRVKALQASGNDSPKAWYIVINSIMKQAQSISKPSGIPNMNMRSLADSKSANSQPEIHVNSSQTRNLWSYHGVDPKKSSKQAREDLEMLSNAVSLFNLSLPSHLVFRNQYLSFEDIQTSRSTSMRQENAGIHTIYCMTQLSKMMIFHYNVFGGSSRSTASKTPLSSGRKKSRETKSSERESFALEQYFEAADNILGIVKRSSDDQIIYMNPFLVSTIWLASAVELVHKEFGPPGTNRVLIKSKYDVLYLTYKKCATFWDIQTAMQHNLEVLEKELELHRIFMEELKGKESASSPVNSVPKEKRKDYVEKAEILLPPLSVPQSIDAANGSANPVLPSISTTLAPTYPEILSQGTWARPGEVFPAPSGRTLNESPTSTEGSLGSASSSTPSNNMIGLLQIPAAQEGEESNLALYLDELLSGFIAY